MSIPLLAPVDVILQRFGAAVFDGSRWAVPTPTETTIEIAVDPSPKRVRSVREDGSTARVDLVAKSYTEIRTASDRDGWSADRIVLDGRTYEVLLSIRSPAFAGVQRESWYIEATEIQPLVVGSTTPIAPVNVTIPTIQGERGVGDSVSFTPGTWTGTQPIAFTYSVLLNGVEVSTATTWTDTAETIDQTLQVVVTAINAASPSGVEAESQPLGNGSGPVDCEVTCADTIAAAVAAAVAPLEAEIAQLEIDLAEAIAERDAVQALYDAALVTIAERDATIVVLNATIATLQAAILRSKGWVNYCTLTPDAVAQATVDTGTGLATLAYVGSGGVDPGDAPCRVSWRLQQADGSATSGYPYGPYLLEIVGTPTVGGLPEIAIVLTDSAAVEATGSYAVWCGQYMTTATSRRIVYGARIAGAAWTRTLGGVGSATDGPCLWTHQPAASSLGAGGSRLTGSNLFSDLTANTTNTAISQQIAGWGTTQALYLHLVVFGGTSFTGTVRVWAPPVVIPRTPA